MKRTIAACVVALTLTACGGGGDEPAPAEAPDSPVTPFVGAVDRANDVADSVNQRTADLESQLQP